MANQLINQAAPIGAPSIPTHQERTMPEEKAAPRQCLYNAGGCHIFEGQEAIDEAFEAGWVDHPDKVGTDP